MRKTLVLILAMMLTVSCSGLPSLFGPTPTPTLTLTPTATVTPTPSPTPTIVPPDPPEAGYSNVYGRVLWHGQPVEGFTMNLTNVYAVVRSELYMFQGATTDRDGRFVFTKVPPGDGFILGPRDYDNENLAGIAGALEMTISVPADANFNFGEYHLVEMDLDLLGPARGSVFSEMPASLSWAAYPGAASYHVELKQENGDYIHVEADTEQTHLDLDPALLDCGYGWDVTAYNADGIPLATSDTAYVDDYSLFNQKHDGLFTIKNDMLPSCNLRVISPYNCFNGGIPKLEIEDNPLAVKYELALDMGTSVIPGPGATGWFFGNYEVRADGRLVGPSLPNLGQGFYKLHITGYTEDGIIFGKSYNIVLVDWWPCD